MPAATVTTTPTLIFKAYNGTRDNPDSWGAQVADGNTGTVYISDDQAGCTSAATNYFSENTTVFSIDLFAGKEIWVCCASGTVPIVWNNFGPTGETYTPQSASGN